MFAIGSGILGVSIGLNAVSTHGACTAIFVAAAAVGVFCFASTQTLGRVSFLAWIGLSSLLTSSELSLIAHILEPICLLTCAVFTVTIGVGVEDRPGDAPKTGHWESDYKIIGNPTFAEAISAVATFIFAYAGTPVFFPIVAEMREPKHYVKALLLCQTIVTITYVTVGVVVYYYCGSYVASPALGSAGKLIKQVAYGIAIPGLLVSATLNTHVGHGTFAPCKLSHNRYRRR